MAKTPTEARQDVYEHIKNSALKAAIKGTLFSRNRSDTSTTEDISINSLPMTASQLQQGVVNVNIHVPNLTLNLGGKIDRSQADEKRLKELSQIAFNVLSEVYTGYYMFEIEQMQEFEEEQIHEFYLNIRLKYRSINNLKQY